MNEIANVCELVGADVDHVRRAIGADRRIGTSFLFPGIGYGGSCFPKDVQALMHFAVAEELRLQDPAGGRDRERTAEDAALHQDEDALRQPEGQDHRRLGARVQAEDRRHARGAVGAADRGAAGGGRQGPGLRPGGDANGEGDSSATGSRFATGNYEALKGADGLAIVTEWNEFRRPDFARMRKLMRTPVVFDGRNLFTPEQMKQNGFTYYSIGRA